MKNKDELYSEARQRLKEYIQSDPTLVEAISLVQRVKEQDPDVWEIGDMEATAMKLATYKFAIARAMNEFRLKANSTYMYRKWKMSKEFSRIKNEAKMAIKEAERRSELEVEAEIEDEIITAYLASYFETLYKNVEQLITTIQTRVRFLRSEMVTDKFNADPFDEADD